MLVLAQAQTVSILKQLNLSDGDTLRQLSPVPYNQHDKNKTDSPQHDFNEHGGSSGEAAAQPPLC